MQIFAKNNYNFGLYSDIFCVFRPHIIKKTFRNGFILQCPNILYIYICFTSKQYYDNQICNHVVL